MSSTKTFYFLVKMQRYYLGECIKLLATIRRNSLLSSTVSLYPLKELGRIDGVRELVSGQEEVDLGE